PEVDENRFLALQDLRLEGRLRHCRHADSVRSWFPTGRTPARAGMFPAESRIEPMSRVFAPLPPVPDHPALEEEVLEWWAEERVFDRLREQNRGGPRSSFIDGPITANNPMGVH